MVFIILLYLVIIYLVYYLYNNYESYQNLNIYPSRLLAMHKFAKLHNNKIISLDIKPIEPSINESQCVIHQCPPYFSDNMTCYKCF